MPRYRDTWNGSASGRPHPRYRRFTEAALAGSESRKRNTGWIAGYLLLLFVRHSDLAFDDLRQERSGRPDDPRKKVAAPGHRNGIGEPAEKTGRAERQGWEIAIMKRRRVFDEVMEGVRAMKAHREGKLTLRSYKSAPPPLPTVDGKFILETRAKFRLFSSRLCAQAPRKRTHSGEVGARPRYSESAGCGSGASGAAISRHARAPGKISLTTSRGISVALGASYFFPSFRARFLIQIGVPTNPNASRIWFSRNR